MKQATKFIYLILSQTNGGISDKSSTRPNLRNKLFYMEFCIKFGHSCKIQNIINYINILCKIKYMIASLVCNKK